MLVNQNGLGWHEQFKSKDEAIAYATEYRNKGFYVSVIETTKVSNYVGD